MRGTLVIIGGAEDKDGDRGILAEFVRLAGGPEADVLVIPVASDWPQETGDRYLRVFEALGVRSAHALPLRDRASADAGEGLEAARSATGVFFTGGDQTRITGVVRGTRLGVELARRYEGDGLVVAGTSAGAAMMSSTMILGGDPKQALRLGGVEFGPGMNFLPGVIVDQHFEERGRMRRLLTAVAQHPHELGVGVDEDTAMIVEGDAFRVLGRNAVTVIDAGGLAHTNLPDVGPHELIAVCGAKIHVLPAGYRFDLRSRTPILAREPLGSAP